MELYKNLKISAKLFVTMALVLFCMALIGLGGIYSTIQLHHIIRHTQSNLIPALDALIQADRDLYQMITAERSLFLVPDKQDNAWKKWMDSYLENRGQAKDRMQRFIKLGLGGDPAAREAYLALEEAWRAKGQEVLNLLEEGSPQAREQAYQLATGEAAQRFGAMRDFLDQQQDRLGAENHANLERSNQLKSNLTWTMVLLFALGLLVGGALTFLNRLTITQPLLGVIAGLKEMASGQGDLTKRLDESSKDELGELTQSFNRFLQQMQSMIQEIAQHAEALGASSQNLTGVSLQMAEITEEVSAQTDSVASATAQVSANIDHLASGSVEVSQSIQSVSATSFQTSQNLGLLTQAVKEVAEVFNQVTDQAEKAAKEAERVGQRTDQVNRVMSNLTKSAVEISKVSGLILGITQQTNLLALNASLEAAAAGDAGRGFSVVAQEVKKLAEKSAQATGSIADKIEEMRESVTQSVEEIKFMLVSVGQVVQSLQQINQVTREQQANTNSMAGQIDESAKGVAEMAHLIEDMASASDAMARTASELAKAAGEISNNVAQVRVAVSNTAQQSSEVSQSSAGLSTIATTLNDMIGRFRLQ